MSSTTTSPRPSPKPDPLPLPIPTHNVQRLRLYVVPGVDQTDLTGDSLYLGELRGNVGDQTYDLPEDFSLTAGSWTVLVWCEAFSVWSSWPPP